MRLSTPLCILVTLLSASGAFAQETPLFNIGLGYAYVKDLDFDQSLPRGIFVSVNGNLNHWLGLTAEMSYARGSFEQDVLTVMIGSKFTARVSARIEPFARVLVGIARQKGSFGDKSVGLALQPGGGVDFLLSKRIAIRAAVDYAVVFESYENEHQLRFTTGIAFRSKRTK